ncbi:MAG: DUF6263 family protein [Chitinophagales bacterium]
MLLLLVASCKDPKPDDGKEAEKKDSTAAIISDTVAIVNTDNPIADEKCIIRFNPTIGTTYTLTNSTNYTMLQELDTAKMKVGSNQYSKVSMKFLSKTDTLYKVEFTIKDLRKSMKGDSVSREYKYGIPDPDPQADMDRKIDDCMVNTPITVYMNEQGEGVDIDGYEAIVKKVSAVVGKDVPDQAVASQLGMPTDNIENYFVIFPDTAIHIGSTWTYSVNSMMDGVPILLHNKYTITDRKDGVIYVKMHTNVDIDRKLIPKEYLDEMVNLKFSASITANYEVDEKTGWPVYVKLNQFMEVSDVYQGHNTHSKNTSSGEFRLLQ